MTISESTVTRLKITITGLVQGVGFRPFIYNLATKLKLNGFIKNTSSGVVIDIEGAKKSLDLFLEKLEIEKPINSKIHTLKKEFADPAHYKNFNIKNSYDIDTINAFISPDLSVCNECVSEMFDKSNKRYLYPFTSCINCGPRFSIIERIPYNRKNTSMKDFKMCKSCEEEYHNPKNRRFHSEINTCSECGPEVTLWDKNGKVLFKKEDSILKTVELIKDGKILAAKGLGGFHLIVDAKNSEAISELRKRKNRKEKPLALMFPSIDAVEEFCYISEVERSILLSKECPIIILKKKNNVSLPEIISPNNPYLGVMLPYTPLHHILIKHLNTPIICTSGNLSNEPICINEDEAKERLKDIADYFLVHDRKILYPIDDSVVKVMADRAVVFRSGRGYAPQAIVLKENTPNIISMGGHLKNTVSISVGDKVFMSQHIGDLENEKAYKIFQNTVENFKRLYNFSPIIVSCDMHPDYLSTKYAYKENKNVYQVQHHHAHILSCMAEHSIDYPVLGIAWDGTGLGLDKTIWGSEFLTVEKNNFKRVAYFSHFKLPGGEKAIKEPRRIALGLLYDVFGDDLFEMRDVKTIQAFSKNELKILKEMLKKDISCVLTSSVGRIFDAISSILGLRQFTDFEGQAAMELEFEGEKFKTNKYYLFEIINDNESEPIIISWSKMIHEIIEDMKNNISISEIACKFHNMLVEIIIEIAKIISIEKIVLSGGCFQNKYLTEYSIKRLTEENFKPYFHHKIPPNDGGISLGQLIAVKDSLCV